MANYLPRQVMRMQNNLRARREMRGYSQAAVVDAFARLGHSTIRQQNLSEWERGVKTPSLENAFLLAKILKCDINDLFALD